MKKLLIGLLLTTSLQSWATPSIEIALILDSSGSMSGLIDKTRDKLWALMNDLENARKDGELPTIELALYSYGNNSNPDAVNEIIKISGLTSDHDELMVEFQKLKAAGGNEYAGEVVTKSLNDLVWDSNGDFKGIFLAGNETLKQGTITIEEAAAQAVDQDVFLNTIYAAATRTFTPRSNHGCYKSRGVCPPTNNLPPATPEIVADPVKQEWQLAAQAGNGSFAHIDHTTDSIHIEAPQDKLIIELDKELNKTFIPYGKDGISSYNRMIGIDGNIGAGNIGSMVSRGRYKAGHNYDTSKWDLVDAYNKNKVDINKLEQEDLPKQLKGLSTIEIIAYIKKMNSKRAEIKVQTAKLYEKRAQFIAKKKAELAAQGNGDELETAMSNLLGNS